MKKLLLSLGLFVATALPAAAADVVELPSGHTALNISATERIQVEQDLLVASLRIQEEGKDARAVQEKINETMKKAVTAAKAMPNVKIETGQYYVHPDYRYIKRSNESDKRVVDKWRGSQTLTLKSKKADEVLKVSGEVQDMGFVMNGLNYRLSPEKYEEIRDGLMETTVEALLSRSKRVAKALGKKKVDLVEINVDAQRPHQPVRYARAAKMEMMASAVSDAMPTPVAEAGESTVSMTIRAQAIIKP